MHITYHTISCILQPFTNKYPFNTIHCGIIQHPSFLTQSLLNRQNQRKGEGGDEDDQTGDAKPKPVESEDVDGAKQSIVPQEEPAAVPAATA